MNPDAISLQFLGMMSLYCLLLLFMFAAGGAPLLALLGERLAVSRRRVFLDKMGGQLAAMGGILALCTLPFSLGVWFVSWAGSWITLYLKQPDMPLPEFSLELAGETSLLCAGVYGLALVLALGYWLTWKPMRKSKAAHSLLGVLAVLASAAAVLTALAVKHATLAFPEIFIAEHTFAMMLDALKQVGPASPLLSLALLCLFMCWAGAAGIGLLYMLLRRSREDFGRDYYAFALKTASSWAIVAGSLALFAGGWLAFALYPELASMQPENIGAYLQQPRILFFLVGLLSLVMACVSWSVLATSATPLRNKPSAVLGAAFLWLAVTFQGVGLLLALQA